MTASVFHGIIHGRTIELEREPGLPEGQPVSVTLVPSRPVGAPTDLEALARLKRAAGTWAEGGDDLERYLEWNRQQRKNGRREISE
jgi:hypothetical protein